MAEDERKATPLLEPPRLPQFSGEGSQADLKDFLREARLVLGAFRFPVRAGAWWVLRSLEGYARYEVESRRNEWTTAADILRILEEEFTVKPDINVVGRAFYTRQQGVAESVMGYSHAMDALAVMCNEAHPGSVTPNLLISRFADGLHPPQLRRDIKRYLRDKPGSSFPEVRQEAMRWMREEAHISSNSPYAQPSAMSLEVEQLRLTVAALTARLEQSSEPPLPEASPRLLLQSAQRLFKFLWPLYQALLLPLPLLALHM
nr:hypothetical protein BaRGS_022608 [Batillaria attramentaria]